MPGSIIERMSMEESMLKYDNTVTDINQTRQELIAKMTPVILQTDFTMDNKTDPDLCIAKSKILSEYRQLLNDADNSRYRHTSLKMKQKDSEVMHQMNIDATAILRQIRLKEFDNGNIVLNTPAEEDIEKKIKERIGDEGCVILSTELEQGHSGLPEKKIDTF